MPDSSEEMSSAPARPRGKGLRLVFALAPVAIVALVSLYSAISVSRSGANQPSEQNWQAASEALREQVHKSDLLTIAPSWLEPVGRLHLGDLMSIEMLARMDSARYETIWEIAFDNARAPETRGLKSDFDARFGPLRLRRYHQDAAELVYDFSSQWKHANVSGQIQGRPSLSLEEVGFAPHRCIKVVPRPGQTGLLRFESVPLGTEIVGYVGLADVFTRRDVRNPGRLEVLVNGDSKAVVMAGVDDGWMRFSAKTAPSSSAVVEFSLTAVGDTAKDRRICFAAEARR